MGMPNPFSGFPVTDDWAAHRARGSLGGVDFGTPVGTPIVAPNPGFVSYEAGNGSGGYIITLALSNSPGYKMQFLHCSAFEGGNRNVRQGEVIGYTGGKKGAAGAGSSTGPHVHVHLVDPNGVREDVMPWFVNAPSAVASVREYQELLNNYGYGLAVDGVNGPLTKAAVRDFQSKRGLTADGVVGPATTAELRKPVPAAPVKPKPEPVKPEPVKPEPVKPEPVKPTKPKQRESITEPKKIPERKPMPTKPEEKIASLPTADLGVIIMKSSHRKLAYALYAGVSIVVTNVAVGFASLGAPFPGWLTVAVAVIGNLAVPFSALAIANAPKKSA